MSKNKQKINKEKTNSFELNFSDITMVESFGHYKRVKEIMESDSTSGNEWCIKTNLNITSEFGECFFKLDFYSNKKVYIILYISSSYGISTTDIGCLSQWCQKNGWEIPEPIESLIKDDVNLWKMLWNTLLINSEYLDNRYGIRKSLK